MKIKDIVNTNIVWISISLVCLLYSKFYEEILYFANPMMQLNDFFMILYQYVVFQIFIFCILKLVGNIFQKNFNINININEKKFFMIFIALLFFYILFIVFIEADILKFTLILSPVRFFVYSFFAVFGFLVGVSYKS